MMDKVVFDGLMKAGYSPNWCLNRRSNSTPKFAYVSYNTSGGRALRRVAQLVMQPDSGSGISYRNGDRLDLRCCNLVVGSGRSKADDFPETEQEHPETTH